MAIPTRPNPPWLFAAFALVAASPALAQDNTVQTTVKTDQVVTTKPAAVEVAPVVVGSHQIDRYEAIRQAQADLRTNPNDLPSWILVGELAHEVALDLPPDQDDAYYSLSRKAYERALALDPTNAGLKAAVQFARDQEAGAAALDAARMKAARVYVDARRRELARAGVVPTLRVWPASLATVPTPAAATTTTTTVARPAPAPVVAPVVAPGYRPYVVAEGTPLTYEQYARGLTVPAADPGVSYVTVRETIRTSPPVNLDEALRRATGVAPKR